MIVRELLTRIGYKVDRRSEQRAALSFDKLKNAAGKLGLALGAGAVAIGFKRMVDAASDVEETMNVVTTAFEDQADSVLRWAKESGEASGRSQYAMREYAATLGAVVGPTLGSAEATADLSTNMAQLAVDLGSFFNATDDDALQALRAGLIGSSEPMLRFGVDMRTAALDAFALREGMGKTMKQMSSQEQILLRYRFILDQTKKAQGDAAKTADSYANLIKRLQGNLQDLQVSIGKEFIPAASDAVKTLSDLAKTMKEPLALAARAMVNAFKFARAVVIGLVEWYSKLSGAMKVAVGLALFFAAAFFTPWLVGFLLLVAAIGGVIVILDDLWAAATKGEGVFAGLFAEFKLLAEQNDSYVTATRLSLQTALDYWIHYFTGVEHGSWRIGEAIRGAFRSAGTFIFDILGLWGSYLGTFARDAIVRFGEISQGIGEAIDAIIEWIGKLGTAIADYVTGKIDALIELIGKLGTAISEFFTEKIDAALGVAKDFFGVIGDLDKFFGLTGPEAIQVPGSPAAARARGEVNSQQSIEININAPGADGSAIAGAVAPAVGRAAADGNRRTAQQLLLGGATP
jgi:hypothetical protein